MAKKIECTFLCGCSNLSQDPVDSSRPYIRWRKDGPEHKPIPAQAELNCYWCERAFTREAYKLGNRDREDSRAVHSWTGQLGTGTVGSLTGSGNSRTPFRPGGPRLLSVPIALRPAVTCSKEFKRDLGSNFAKLKALKDVRADIVEQHKSKLTVGDQQNQTGHSGGRV